MKCLELFSGAGGLAKGLEEAGVTHSAFVEHNKYACESLKSNFNKNIVFNTDVRDFKFSDLSNIDIIAGGPPCQPFSLGGKHQGGMDKRDLFPYAIKAIRELMPKTFIFENVKGLLRKSFSTYFNYIILQLNYPEHIRNKDEDWIIHLKRLEEIHTKGNLNTLKYNIVYRLINAADYGVPQSRERVIIVGIRSDLDISWSFPSPTHSKEALLWDKFVTTKYWKKHNVPVEHNSQVENRLIAKYGMLAPQEKAWRTIRDSIYDLPEPSGRYNSILPDHVLKPGAKIYPGHTGSELDSPSKTIKAGVHGVPGGENMIRFASGAVRYFTLLEAKRIQTFPDNYNIKGAWSEAMRQIGNAVPVQLGKIISESLVGKITQSITVKHYNSA